MKGLRWCRQVGRMKEGNQVGRGRELGGEGKPVLVPGEGLEGWGRRGGAGQKEGQDENEFTGYGGA